MATAPPTINALPAPPDPNDRSTFNARAYPWSVAQQTLATEVGAVAENVYSNAQAAESGATAAANQVVLASDQAVLAQSAATAASATAGATQWASGATYAIGDCVWSPLNQQVYRRKVAGAGTTDPSADATNWTQVGGGSASLQRSDRTSNTILGASDKGKLIDITSGTFTQTFAAAATLGDGWVCYIRNSGTGDITLDPDAAEQIDGLTSYVMYSGEVRLVQCDGVALRTVVLNGFYKTFAASGEFIKPPGYAVFEGLAWSGGASGQKNGNSAAASAGGSGGGCFPFALRSSAFASSTTMTVGAGGAAVSSVAAGSAGGNTSVGSLLTVLGAKSTASGDGGSVSLAGKALSAPAASVGGARGFDPGIGNSGQGSSVYGGAGSDNSAGNFSGSSVYGGAAGGCVNSSAVANPPGASVFGGSGGAASSSASGSDGLIPAGGGGATQTGVASGAGARGEIRIWGII